MKLPKKPILLSVYELYCAFKNFFKGTFNYRASGVEPDQLQIPGEKEGGLLLRIGTYKSLIKDVSYGTPPTAENKDDFHLNLVLYAQALSHRINLLIQ